MKGLFETPSTYVQSIDWATHEAVVVPMTRMTYVQSNFLDQRTISAGKPETIALDVLIQTFGLDQPPPRRLNFIFHTAFCGSTLLSRCLDHPGVCLAYKEPFILHQLAFSLRQDPDTSRAIERDDFLGIALALLSRSYSPREIPLIKPSESCINLARDLLRRHPDSAAILLHMPLRPFVVSMLKLPKLRQYMRSHILRAQHDLQVFGFDYIDSTHLNDAQAAGLIWLGLMVPYCDLLADQELNVRSLDASLLYAHPQQVLEEAARLFDLSLKAETIKRVVEEGVYRRHSKKPTLIFDRTTNALETKKHQQSLTPEICEAVAWVDEITRCRPLPLELSRPLLPSR